MNKIKTLKLNVITSILPWIVLAIIGFVKIRFFINVYGDETNGFIQLITQIYGYLSLVEMGFGSAIMFRLYKPLARDDKETAVKLFNGSKKIYKNIAIKLSTLAFVTAFFVPHFVTVQGMSKLKMIAIFLIFAVDYFAKYIFDLPYRTLLYADQKRYKANIIINISTLIVKIVELFLILTGIDYIIVLTSNVLINISSYIVFRNIVKREYDWLNITSEADTSTKEMSKDIMGHKISRIVFYGTDNIIISLSKNLGLAATSVYGSYNYIISAIRNVLELFFSSPLEILGNKFAKEENKNEENECLYKEILSATYYIGIITCVVFFVSISKLIGIWINTRYVLDTVTIFIFSLYIWYECVGRTNLTMIEAGGKYKETKIIEISCAILNIALSIILAQFFGIAGVIAGSVISLMVIKHPFQIKFLYKDLFKKEMTKSYMTFIINTFVMITMSFINLFVIRILNIYQGVNFIKWFLITSVIAIVNVIILFAFYYVFYKSFRKMIMRFVNRSK